MVTCKMEENILKVMQSYSFLFRHRGPGIPKCGKKHIPVYKLKNLLLGR
jgi:hypothetical protein